MTEPAMIVLLTSGPLCWLIGGIWWKPARRFLWPLVVGVGLSLTVPTLSLLACVGSLMLVNSLPYGDRTPWWGRTLVFQALMIPALWISPHFWWFGILMGSWLLGLFYLTRLDRKSV